MKSREWTPRLLGVGLALALVAVALLAWQLRIRYEQELTQAIWPAMPASVVEASRDGNLSPPTLFLGDSRIQQWRLSPPSSGSTVNAGISGATTVRILETSPALLERYHPDVVVIEAGINDLKLVGMRPSMSREIVDEAASNLQRIIDLCRGRRCKVLLLLVWPAAAPDLLRWPVWNASAISAAVSDLNQRLRSLENPKAGVAVYDIFAMLGEKPRYRDTLHLEQETYDRLMPILDRRIQELRSDPSARWFSVGTRMSAVSALPGWAVQEY